MSVPTPSQDGVIGLDVLTKAFDSAWVSLRSFDLEFIDDRVMRVECAVSIDLAKTQANHDTQQLASETHSNATNHTLIPVAARSPEGGFRIEVRDEEDRLLPSLSDSEERDLMANALATFAKAHGSVTEDYDDIRANIRERIKFNSDPEERRKLIVKCFPEVDWMRNLFSEYLDFISSNRYVIVDVRNGGTVDKRLLRYSYDVPTNKLEIVGDGRASFEVNFALGGPTLNAEMRMRAPYDMSFTEASICQLDETAGKWRPVDGAQQVSILSDVLHFTVPRDSAFAHLKCVGSMALRPTGLIRSAIYTSWLSVVTLLVVFFAPQLRGEWLWHHLSRSTSSIDALVAILLLLVPATVSAYTAMPSKHILTTTTLFKTRRTIWTSSALSFAAALAIGLSFPPNVLMAVWALVIFGTAVIAWKLTQQYRILRRLDEVDRPLSAADPRGDACSE